MTIDGFIERANTNLSPACVTKTGCLYLKSPVSIHNLFLSQSINVCFLIIIMQSFDPYLRLEFYKSVKVNG